MTLATEQSAALAADKPLHSARSATISVFKRSSRYACAVILGGIRNIEDNMVPICICAAIMFPAYWFVWKFLFPQPYENIWIRLLGSLFCLLVAAKGHWPRPLRRYLPVVWLGAVLYSGPFFFTFMLLQNNISTVWLMSTMAGLFLVVLLLDWISMFVLFVAGSAVAWGIHVLISPGVTPINLYLEFVPIFLFALTAGAIFNYKAAGLRQAKERARRELGVLLAKEMQLPLTTIRTSAASLGKTLPILVGAYPERQQQESALELKARELSALQRVPARIEGALEQMDGIIEVLAAESGESGSGQRRALSMLRCLDDAIVRLSLSELDGARLSVERGYDFIFYGSPILMAHLLARVIEAALSENCGERGTRLVVSLGQAGSWNYVRLTDFSEELRGMPARLFSRLVRNDQAFSNRPDLALANLALERTGGFVTRTLALGRTDETVLWFAQPGI